MQHVSLILLIGSMQCVAPDMARQGCHSWHAAHESATPLSFLQYKGSLLPLPFRIAIELLLTSLTAHGAVTAAVTCITVHRPQLVM